MWAGTFTSLGGQPKSGLLSLAFLFAPAEMLLLGVTYDPGSLDHVNDGSGPRIGNTPGK